MRRFERANILMTWSSEKGVGQPNELIHQQVMASFHITLQVVLNISSNLYYIRKFITLYNKNFVQCMCHLLRQCFKQKESTIINYGINMRKDRLSGQNGGLHDRCIQIH